MTAPLQIAPARYAQDEKAIDTLLVSGREATCIFPTLERHVIPSFVSIKKARGKMEHRSTHKKSRRMYSSLKHPERLPLTTAWAFLLFFETSNTTYDKIYVL